MRKHILILALAAFALVAVVGPTVARGPKDHSWKDFPSKSEERTIMGLVERTDNGIALVSSGGHTYMVTGKDLSRFVGKKVAATGEISTAEGRDTIAVTSYRTCEFCQEAERDKLSNLGVCVAEREGGRDKVASFPLIDRPGTSSGVDKEQLARRASLAVLKEG